MYVKFRPEKKIDLTAKIEPESPLVPSPLIKPMQVLSAMKLTMSEATIIHLQIFQVRRGAYVPFYRQISKVTFGSESCECFANMSQRQLNVEVN